MKTKMDNRCPFTVSQRADCKTTRLNATATTQEAAFHSPVGSKYIRTPPSDQNTAEGQAKPSPRDIKRGCAWTQTAGTIACSLPFLLGASEYSPVEKKDIQQVLQQYYKQSRVDPVGASDSEKKKRQNEMRQ